MAEDRMSFGSAPLREEEQHLTSRRRFLLSSAALLGGGALLAAMPGTAKAHETNDPPLDTDMLNFALTLEHLEATFYVQGLEAFSKKDFQRSNLFRGSGNSIRKTVYKNFERIRDHEVEHVDTLTKVLGDAAVPPCTYNFETTAFTSLEQFVSVAQILENTGVMAYDGAIAHIESDGASPEGALLTAGAQIATVEARHASYLNLLNGDVPFPEAFDTPKAPQEIFDTASNFIVSCPEPYGPYTNAAAFRALLPTEVIGGVPAEGL